MFYNISNRYFYNKNFLIRIVTKTKTFILIKVNNFVFSREVRTSYIFQRK